MDITIYPKKLAGTVEAIPSKSQAHRLLICSAFSDKPTYLNCPQTNQDIEATANCLNKMGANVVRTPGGYWVTPVDSIPRNAVLDCGESGSTLRFLLPIVCALGIQTTFQLHGRLPYRPLTPLWEELERMGCRLTRPTENTIAVYGKLRAGVFTIRGDVSSQFISGLLFAAALLQSDCEIHIIGTLESKPYVDMTCLALKTFGVQTDGFRISGTFPFHTPGNINIEGDWSNGAFFLAAAALGNAVDTTNLDPASPQGDRAISQILSNVSKPASINASDIPDLVPILAVVFGAKSGAVFTGVRRLRLKESDRIASVCDMLNALGATAIATDDTLTVTPGVYHSCTINAVGDHRIAMAAAIAATIATGPVTILGAQCVSKSYPTFWTEYQRLGGHYE